MQNTSNLLSFSRIIIYCANVNVLKDFYQEHFTLKLTEEIRNEWAVLKAGEIEIAFHRIGEAYRSKEGSFRAQSNVKLVFKIPGDMYEFRRELAGKGVVMREIKSYTGFGHLLCDGEDPEGNVFQLMQLAK